MEALSLSTRSPPVIIIIAPKVFKYLSKIYLPLENRFFILQKLKNNKVNKREGNENKLRLKNAYQPVEDHRRTDRAEQ